MEAGAVAVADEKVVGEYYTLSQHMDKTREVSSPSTPLILKLACSLIIVSCVGVCVCSKCVPSSTNLAMCSAFSNLAA